MMGFLEKKGVTLQELSKRWQGKRFCELLYKHVYDTTTEKLEISILGTIETMPEGYDVLMDEWMDGWRHRNSQKLIALLDCDLSQVFNDTLAEERVFLATKKIDQYDDNLLFDMFNLVVLDLALFAHRNDSFRQSMAAKRNLGCLTLVIAGLGLLALTIFAL